MRPRLEITNFDFKSNEVLQPRRLLPPCRGKVGMGVEALVGIVSTPTLALPLHGGGDVG